PGPEGLVHASAIEQVADDDVNDPLDEGVHLRYLCDGVKADPAVLLDDGMSCIPASTLINHDSEMEIEDIYEDPHSMANDDASDSGDIEYASPVPESSAPTQTTVATEELESMFSHCDSPGISSATSPAPGSTASPAPESTHDNEDDLSTPVTQPEHTHGRTLRQPPLKLPPVFPPTSRRNIIFPPRFGVMKPMKGMPRTSAHDAPPPVEVPTPPSMPSSTPVSSPALSEEYVALCNDVQEISDLIQRRNKAGTRLEKKDEIWVHKMLRYIRSKAKALKEKQTVQWCAHIRTNGDQL
ncbi:hypothetical protein DENSPDRAFT_855748, partial [Dentipellis sp. KUC8613]